MSVGLIAVAIALYALALFFLVRTTGPAHMRVRPLPLAILTGQMSAYVAFATYAVLRRSDSVRAAILLGMTAAFLVEGVEFFLGYDTTASLLVFAAMPLLLSSGFALIESPSWLRSFLLGLLAAGAAVVGVYATLYLQRGF